jgi:hypothetical protein
METDLIIDKKIVKLYAPIATQLKPGVSVGGCELFFIGILILVGLLISGFLLNNRIQNSKLIGIRNLRF